MHLPSKRSIPQTENKFCSKCKTWKLRTSFSNDKNRRDGKYPECSECKNKPRVIVSGEMFHCVACGVEHHKSMFSFDKRKKSGLQASCRQSRKAYYETTKKQVIERALVAHKTNYVTVKGRADHLWRGARIRARARNIEFNIDRLYVEIMLLTGRCNRSGIPFSLEFKGTRKRNPFAPSLDRIDNEKGYVIGNVQLVCNLFNAGKNDVLEVDFIAMCIGVANNNQNNDKALRRLNELNNAEL